METNKYYKVVREYKGRWFSTNSLSPEIDRIISKKARTSRFVTVEYKLNQWIYKPRIGYYHLQVQRKLFVLDNLDAAKRICNLSFFYPRLYECEVINPSTVQEIDPNIVGNHVGTILVDAVKLTKLIYKNN